MSQTPGFLKFVLSKGKRYVYLVTAEKRNKKIKTNTIYRFGPLDIALENMYDMRDYFEERFPKELIDKDYDWSDLNDWILSIETGYSKNEKRLIIHNVDLKESCGQMNLSSHM